jgi:hypothetical protein
MHIPKDFTSINGEDLREGIEHHRFSFIKALLLQKLHFLEIKSFAFSKICDFRVKNLYLIRFS